MFYVSAWFYGLTWLGQPLYIGPFVDQQACHEARQQYDTNGVTECFEGLEERAYAHGGETRGNHHRDFGGLGPARYRGGVGPRLAQHDGG